MARAGSGPVRTRQASKDAQVKALFDAAIGRWREGRTDETKTLLEQALAIDPRHADVLQILGVLAAEAGRFEDAAGLFRRAASARPSDPIARYNLGNALKDLRRLDDAVTAYRNALVLRPDYPEALNNMGVALQDLGRNLEAIEAYERARRLKPDYVEAWFNLGNVLKAIGRNIEAVEAYDRALALRPTYAAAHNNRGVALKQMGRHEAAIEAFRQSMALDPKDVLAVNNLGVALEALSRHAEAAETYRQAIVLDPSRAEAHNNLGVALKNLGHFDEAEAAYARALVLRPDYAEALVNVAVNLEEAGRPAEARVSVDRALAIDPSLAHAWSVRASLKTFTAGDPDIAAMQSLLDPAQLVRPGAEDVARLEFALGKAWMDIGQAEPAFVHLGRGAAVKRATLAYDGPAACGWMRRLAETYDAEMLARLGGGGDPSDLPVFVVGMPRSGTSLVEQILASHPQVVGAGELGLLEDIARGAPPQGLDLSEAELARELTPKQLAWAGGEYVRRLAEVAGDARRVVDKMPGNFHFAGLAALILPRARIIHCRRDPADTCLSCYSKLFTDGQAFSYDLTELGRYYRSYERLMAHWRAVLPAEQFTEVVYEELVADQESQTRRLLAACGLDWDPACLAFHQTQRAVRTASSGQVRKPLYRSSLGRWRPYETQLAPLLKALAEPAPGWD